MSHHHRKSFASRIQNAERQNTINLSPVLSLKQFVESCRNCGNKTKGGHTGEVTDPTSGKPTYYECSKCGARGVIVSREDEGKLFELG